MEAMIELSVGHIILIALAAFTMGVVVALRLLRKRFPPER